MEGAQDLEAQEARLLAALRRIDAAQRDLAAKPATTDQSDEVAALRAELAAAKAVASAPSAPDPELEGLRAEVARLKADLAGAEAGHAETIAALRSDLAAARAAPAGPQAGDLPILEELRQAAQSGVTDAGLINRALEAELEALKAARAADLQELQGLVSDLDPLLEGGAHA